MTPSEIADLAAKLLPVFLSLPAVLLVLALIYRKPLLALFANLNEKIAKQELSEIELGTGGVSAKFIKAETSAGQMDVTIPKIESDPGKDDLVSYTSGQYKFSISWNEKTYYGSTDGAKQAESKLRAQIPGLFQQNIPFLIERKQPFDNYTPNVNVVVEAIEKETSIAKYLHLNVQAMKALGFEVLSSKIDDNSNSGFIEYNLISEGEKKGFLFAKLVIDSDMGYTVTATVPQDQDPQSNSNPMELLQNLEIRNELRTILNSFALVKSPKK